MHSTLPATSGLSSVCHRMNAFLSLFARLFLLPSALPADHVETGLILVRFGRPKQIPDQHAESGTANDPAGDPGAYQSARSGAEAERWGETGHGNETEWIRVPGAALRQSGLSDPLQVLQPAGDLIMDRFQARLLWLESMPRNHDVLARLHLDEQKVLVNACMLNAGPR